MDFVRGLIVRASAGRDKGGFFAVLAAGDDGYALICDGRRRRLEHPKRKKVKHLFPTSAVLAEGSMQTNREIRKDERPALKDTVEHMDEYDIVFVGYPNWNADLPMPLYTFLEEYDFSGKTIIPFNTHGGSGFSRTVQTISELQPNATVRSDGLSISRNDVEGAESEVVNWVQSLNLAAE